MAPGVCGRESASPVQGGAWRGVLRAVAAGVEREWGGGSIGRGRGEHDVERQCGRACDGEG